MGLMDMLKTSDPMAKFYAAADRSNIPQGGVTGAAFQALFPHGAGNVLFGRQPQPMPQMDTQEGTQYLADLASNMMTPGTFIGPKGMGRLFGDDAAKGLMSAAEVKLSQGVPREKVFQELGVFKGPEGKWRYEIDDSGMTGVRGGMGSYGVAENPEAFVSKVGDAVNHDTLFAAHPSLRYMNLEVNPAHNTLGSHYEGNIALKGDVSTQREWVTDAKRLAEEFAQNDFKAGDFGSLKEALDYHNAEFAKDSKYGDLSNNDASTLLHELQHAVQGREGFAAGGSPSLPLGLLEIENNAIPSLKKRIAKNQADFSNSYDDAIYEQLRQDRRLLEQLSAAVDSPHLSEYESLLSSYGDEAYRRLAGEAESRSVQDRMNMSMTDRRNNFPQYATRNDLVVRGLMSGGE